MKKAYKLIIICTLCLCFILSGCNCNDNGDDNSTGKYIMQNGATEYSIVVPAGLEEEDDEQYAANELRLFFEEATGVKLPVITDEGLTYSESGKYLSVGDTELLRQSGIERDMSLTFNGYQVITKGDGVFMIGRSTNGTINAVYEFLNQTLCYEYFTYDTYTLDKGVTEISLPAFDVKKMPDVTYQQFSHMAAYWDKDYRQRMFMNEGSDIFNNPARSTNGWIHNSFAWYPLDIYGPDGTDPHIKWYGANYQQLCYNAGGDAVEYEAMQQVFVDTAMEMIRRKPEVRVLGFSHEDQNVWCTCDTCKAETEKYGTGAASVIQFLNEAMVKVMAEVEKDPELKGNTYEAMFFAYNPTVNPPAKTDGNGNYSPIDDSVIMSENVSVMIAPILSVFYLPYDDAANESYYKALMGWKACKGNLYLWNYDYSYASELVPFTLHNSAKQTKKIFLEAGLKGVFHETMFDTRVSAFREYSVYQQTRINWDVDVNLQQLTDKYFNAVYGPAAEVMLDLYELIRIRQELDYRSRITDGVSFSYSMDNAEAFPYGELLLYMQKIEEAFSIVEEYRYDEPERYEKWKEAIMLESFFPRYFIIQHYSTYYTDAELYEMKTSFRVNAENTGLNYDSLYSTWGI